MSSLTIKQETNDKRVSVISTIVIPPTDGSAIGTITSAPRPCEVITGISARIVVAVTR